MPELTACEPLRRELDAAMSALRVIGRLTEDERIVAICKAVIEGRAHGDSERIDAVIEAEADIEKTLHETWRVTAYEEYEDADLRVAMDKLVEAMKG